MSLRDECKRLIRKWSLDETPKLMRVLQAVSRRAKVVEAGPGRGRRMLLLRDMGFTDVVGVEVNPALVEQARNRGLDVSTPEEFAQRHEPGAFDLAVFSHVIEHMGPDGARDFLHAYFKYLKPEGLALVATPTLHPGFFFDFDHAKPYYPQGLKAFFGSGDEQVSSPGRYELSLKDIRFRRSPLAFRLHRSLMLKRGDAPLLLANAALALLFKASFGLMGRTTGWIGLFKVRAHQRAD